jgi:hypothetical protein
MMGNSGWVLLVTTLLGPVLAVQAQKWIERFRDREQRKRWTIYTLMATRGARLSQEHVRALNGIDLTFYGTHFLWRRHQTEKERAVIVAWRKYLDHLNTTRPEAANDAQKTWDEKTNDYFFNLLGAIALERRYEFDLVEIKRGNYNPMGHFTSELEGMALRKLAVRWLSGENAVNINVAALTHPAGATAQPTPTV